ncbi:putative reverse transcriptase domain-containing protein [Tanacetum coccineum]
MSEFCEKKGIKKEFSAARTPQQNGVAERRNRTLIEAARTMLADSKLPTTFWAEEVNTTCYVQNRVLVVKPHNKTPYELFRGRTPALSFMRPFGCHVTILNTIDYLGKFNGKSDEGFFDKPIIADDGPKWLFDIDVLTKSMNYVPVVAGINSNDLVGAALTWWNGHVRTLGHDVVYAMTWGILKKKLTDKYCLKGEIKKLKFELWNLRTEKINKYISRLPDNIHGNVMSVRPKTLDDAIELANELMDHNTNNQQYHKKQNIARAYTVGLGEKKAYARTLPLCTKCNYHHTGQCAPKCGNYKRYGHATNNCRVNTNNNNNNNNNNKNQKAGACYECGNTGHIKKNCPKLKNRRNNNGNGTAQGRAYALGGRDASPDSNVITGTFLLNNRYATILFDTGADRSFVSNTFSALINITPTTLENHYDVELADGKIIGVNTIIRGCTLNFMNHPFNIDLMSVPLGSFDVIIGMDWLTKYHGVIICDEKIGCDVFLAHITMKEAKDKSKGKRLEDVPIVKDFPEVFPEDFPGIPPAQQVEFQIDLVPGVAPVPRAPYRLAPSKMKELAEQLQELSDKGFIRPSSSPWGASVLFVKKKDRLFCMYTDYLELNKLTFSDTRDEDSKDIHVDPANIESIKDWAYPKSPTEICQFLGLSDYYRRFIKGFSKIAKSMTKLTQKNVKFDWGEKEEAAFQLIKQKLCSLPILGLTMGHKLWLFIAMHRIRIHEKNYTTHDLELGAVVFALKMWRHYLYETRCAVFTDQKSLQHILDQKELNMRQRRWLELLSDYDCDIRYHPGKANVVA